MGYNKKNSITIHFEENDELMKEIDSLVSERAKVIARSYIDQQIMREMQRIVIDQMKQIRMGSYLQSVVCELLKSDKGKQITEQIVRGMVRETAQAKIDAKLDSVLEKAVYAHFNGIASSDVVKVILDYYRQNVVNPYANKEGLPL